MDSNKYGGRENAEAIAFLRRFNTEVFARFPQATTAAEESTAWPQVSRPVEFGGLGFGYKWNMGWMHDTLNYIGKDPIHRKHHHGDILFGLHYAFSENFILPLSHDEVVHGKRSILGRMPGDDWQRFANLRAYYSFMFGHPGKKLMFMELPEFGQEREWDHDCSLDWHAAEQGKYAGVQSLVRDLNWLYRETPALHELDCDPAGFEWVITRTPTTTCSPGSEKGSWCARPMPGGREFFRQTCFTITASACRLPAGGSRFSIRTPRIMAAATSATSARSIPWTAPGPSSASPFRLWPLFFSYRKANACVCPPEPSRGSAQAGMAGALIVASFSANAEKVELCLFDSGAAAKLERIRAARAWQRGHLYGYLNDISPGQLYGYRSAWNP